MNEFTAKAISLIQGIPEGKVMTYGQIAALAGNPKAARQVVRILHAMSDKHHLPWYRVVNAKGELPLGDDGQALYLQIDGVDVSDGHRVDLGRFQFHPFH